MPSETPDDDLSIFRGSVLTQAGEFRFTRRCLIEDLGVPAGARDAELAGLAPIDGIAAWQTVPAAGGDGFAVAGDIAVASHHGATWILACGRTAAQVSELIAEGVLWPDAEDFRLRADDHMAYALNVLRIEAPLGLRRARETPGLTIEVDGPLPHYVAIEVSADDGSTFVAMEVPGGGAFGEIRSRRLIAVTLACVHTDSDWAAVDELPSGQAPGTIVFRHPSAG